MVRFRETVEPNPEWQAAYVEGLRRFTRAAKIKRHQ